MYDVRWLFWRVLRSITILYLDIFIYLLLWRGCWKDVGFLARWGKVMRFVSKSLCLDSSVGADWDACCCHNYSLGWTVTHPSSVPHSVCLTSNIARLRRYAHSHLRLVRVDVRDSYSRRYRPLQFLLASAWGVNFRVRDENFVNIWFLNFRDSEKFSSLSRKLMFNVSSEIFAILRQNWSLKASKASHQACAVVFLFLFEIVDDIVHFLFLKRAINHISDCVMNLDV